MKIYLIFCLILFRPLLAQIPTPVEGWPHFSTTDGYIQYAVPRFGLDDSQLCLIYNNINGEVQKFYLNGDFASGWPVSFDTLIFNHTPIILDIDHDERCEMLTLGIRNSSGYPYYLILVDDDGSIMPGFPIGGVFIYAYAAADLDGDNEYEIIYFDADSDLVGCVDRFGNPKPGWPLSFHMPRSEYSLTGGIAIGDLDLDGNNEFLLSGFREIYAFRYDGSMQPGFPINLQEDSLYAYAMNGAPPTMADMDGDGFLEILFCGDNWSPINPINYRSFLIIYENDGTIKTGYPRYYEGMIIKNVPTPADINNDGLPEMGFQYGESLTFVDINCQPLPGWPARFLGPDGLVRGPNSDLITVDINGDGNCEIFMDYNTFFPDSLGQDSLWYYGHSFLFATDNSGHDLPGYPIEVRGAYFRMPPSFAIEPSTSRLYMSLATDFLMPGWNDTIFLELYVFPNPTGPADQWPMLNHDNLHTRNYNFVDRVTSIYDEGNDILPKTAILKQNYPNPFNFTTMIEFTIPQKEYVTLSVFDILGRKVIDLYDQEMEAGSYHHRLSMKVPSGVYLYNLKAGDTEVTRKMTLLK